MKSRHKGWRGVAAAISAKTGGMEELVDWALAVWRDTSLPMSDRWKAHEWLSQRGLGNPVSVVDMQISDAREAPDLSALPVEALEQIDTLFRAALAAPKPATDVVEAEIVDDKPDV